MTQYPIQFNYNTQSSSGIATAWSTQSPENRTSPCAIPPEFDGPGGGFSPEDFFGLALLNCFIATFKVIAEKSRVEFESVAASGTLVVDRDTRGRPTMKEFTLRAQITPGANGNKERIERVFNKTTESCIVANSVVTEVRFSFEFV